MVSVTSEDEALEAMRGGADIIDVKNPFEGALGAQLPAVTRKIREGLPGIVEVSATLGDLPYLPGTASLAAVGAASLGIDYVKAGLFGVKNVEEALAMVQAIKSSLKSLGFKAKLVICGYADHAEYGCINPKILPEVAYKGEAEGILIDVKRKAEGLTLFNFIGEKEIVEIQAKTKRFGLFLALAGGLNLKEIEKCSQLRVDVIGVRRYALTSLGKISRSRIAEACKIIRDQNL
jgi:hypothetical protein